MKATKKEDLLSYEDILRKLNGGYDGYMYYNGLVRTKCKCPWRKDKNASFGFYQKEGIWRFRDFATEDNGGLVEFVMKMFNLSFVDAINKIKWDFGLTQVKNLDAVKVTWDRPLVEDKPALITYKLQRFNQRHKDFWEPVGVSEDYCKNYNCFAIKELSINRNKIPINNVERVFLYWENTLQRVKVYFPDRLDDKFKNNVPGTHLWYLDKYSECDKLIVCKSNKDAIVLSQFGLCVSATQQEGLSCIEPNTEKLNLKSKDIIICYGNDRQGWDESFKITKKFGYRHFNIPQEELELGINDPYSYIFRYGIKAMEDLLKLKKLI